MTGGALETAVIVSSLVLAAWCLVTTAMNRPTTRLHIIGLVAVELVVMAMVIVAFGKVVGGELPHEVPTFVGYLVMTAFLLPVGAAWSLLDRSRWGPAVIAVAALVVPVLVVRLQQIWRLGIG